MHYCKVRWKYGLWLLIAGCSFAGYLSAQVPVLVDAVEAYRYDDLNLADSLLRWAEPYYPATTRPDSCAFIQLYRAEVAFEQNEEDVAGEWFKRAEETMLQNYAHPEQFDFYYLILQGRGVTAVNPVKDYRQAAIDQVFAHQRDQAEPMADAFQSMAWQAWETQDYDLVLERLDSALYYGRHTYCPRDLGQLYANFSSAYYVNGDRERALVNQQLATTICRKPLDQAINLIHEGEALTDLRRYTAAAERFRLAKELIEGQDLGEELYRQLLCFQAQLAREMGDWEAVDDNLDRLKSSFLDLPDPISSVYYEYYLTYSASKAIALRDYEAAGNWLDRYEHAAGAGSFSTTVYSYYFLRSKEYAGTGRYEPAIGLLANLIAANEYNQLAESYRDWAAEQFSFDNQSIIWVKDLASYLLSRYQAQEIAADLADTDFLLDLADELIQRARSANYQLANRLTLNEIALEVSNLRMVTYRIRYRTDGNPTWITLALNASAGVKQRWVSDRYYDRWLRKELAVNDDLVQREERLAGEIREQLREAEGWSELPDREALETIRRNVDSLRNEQDRLHAELEISAGDYLAERYALPRLSVDSVRSLLKDEEVLLQFLDLDTALYVVAVSEDSAQFIYLPLNQPLSRRIPALLDSLDQRALGPNLFLELHALYQEILAPLEPFVGRSDLLIIPDGHLWYLPFNALIAGLSSVGPQVYFDHRYLIQDRRVRYHLSTLVAMIDNRSGEGPPLGSQELRAFCPMSEVSVAGFSALPMSAQTARLLRQTAGVPRKNCLLAATATEAAFWRATNESRLLHLDTHAELQADNPERSYLQLYPGTDTDGRLYAYQLADMGAEVDLAVLMACRTADGKLYKGQGVANLGRDMMRGGTRGLVLNLWRVSDDMSHRLMAEFYPALLINERSPADALRLAQLSQLAVERTAHPADWATAIYLGRNEPLRVLAKKDSKWWMWLAGGGALLLLLYWRFSVVRSAHKPL